MNTQQMFLLLSDLQPDELILLQNFTKDFSEEKQQQFLMMYKSRRKEKKDLLLLALLGFIGFAGIHRFAIGEIGIGVLFFLTFGFFGIATIVDILSVNKLVSRYNQKEAFIIMSMFKGG